MASSNIFWVIGMTRRTGIEPWTLAPLVNTLTARPMDSEYKYTFIYMSVYARVSVYTTPTYKQNLTHG